MAKKKNDRQSRQATAAGKEGRGGVTLTRLTEPASLMTIRSLSTAAICIVSGTDVRITISGRSLRLVGLDYPQSGRIREYIQAELDAGVPITPYDSSGDPLSDVDDIGSINQTNGQWQMVITDHACSTTGPTEVFYVIWWQYENATSVHHCTEALRIVIPPCSALSPC